MTKKALKIQAVVEQSININNKKKMEKNGEMFMSKIRFDKNRLTKNFIALNNLLSIHFKDLWPHNTVIAFGQLLKNILLLKLLSVYLLCASI